ncbi:MAG: ABC transporter substrate-binding protein, partial [Anaerolineae bacterium]|nr:ABC transporter substrate-binding protein [Anaerolineae bacterium]
EPEVEPEEPEVEPEEPVAPVEPETPAGKFNEAPMLAALVASGALPSVDERLPLNPYVCEVAEMTGNYGGTIRRGFKGVSDAWGPTKHIDRLLAWYDRDLVMQPRLIESWDVSDDATTVTMHLRKGLKSSDGSAFTSADFKWYYENYAQNEELQPSPPTNLCTVDQDGNKVLCVAEFPDDDTVVYKFAHPNPLFFYGGTRSIRGFCAPGDYMAQFHMELTEDKDALEAAVVEAGFGSWTELYEDRLLWHMNKEKPMVTPWLAKNSLAEELFLMERNPYYFAVDPDGNQLPYLDTVSHRLFETPEVFNLWIVNGEIDFQQRHVSIADYSLFKENEANGDYRVLLGLKAEHSALQLNLATKEPKLNEFFNTREVRTGISHAMNRDEVNGLIYDGLLVPRQYSPLPLSPNYYPKLSNAYLEYDPDLANQMLDDAGYDQKDADGYRMWKDGSGPITFTIESSTGMSFQEDELGLVVKYLNDVGLKVTYKFFERSLYTEHFNNNEIEGAWWGGDRTVLPLAPAAIIFRGVQPDRPWAAGYGLWFVSNGTDPNGVEPPAGHFIWDIWDVWSQIEREPDPDEQNALFEQILDIWAEELPMIGLLGEAPAPIIVKNGFRNYLPGMPIDDTTGDEHYLQTETYFWENPEEHMG